ncbi:hypothetical protein ACLKA6_012635 [Drosophila palustris]
MIQLYHSHTGIYIKEKIINILQDYDIELDQIFSITSDNGKNMIKAIEILNDETEESQESQESLLDDEKTEDDLMEKLEMKLLSQRDLNDLVPDLELT